ncbi:unnamed protein product [Rhodiola kirilowii]
MIYVRSNILVDQPNISKEEVIILIKASTAGNLGLDELSASQHLLHSIKR